ncbi:MAG: thioredoxin domain-containing protein [Azospirillaceae bacterium]
MTAQTPSDSPSRPESAPEGGRNRLAEETSPYLLQHANNPVDWRPWGPEALAAAKRGDRPILLSVGYAACHWCHVMAHESFEDPEVAALMNDLFVNIKVDREERPDLDQIYQNALALTGQHGGWPLTMFLTPDGDPFWGGTYFPKDARYGRPGFPEVLRAVAETYAREPEKVTKNVEALRHALTRMGDNQAGGAIDPDALDAAAGALVRHVDPIWGGVGRAPKFPQSALMELLWRAYLRNGDRECRDAVLRTLTRMCQGGIYDHLGGGFARYSVDEEWLVPHFEKMLYDNAQMIRILTLVWQETRTPLYAARVRETVAWVFDEMIGEGGAFAASLDADSEGEEGRYYVWTEAEIDALLSPDAAALFKEVYDVGPHGNWEGRTILNRRHEPALRDADEEAALAESRAILKAERDKRVRPGWDDKILADWNGLMIAALAEAGLVFDEPDWIAAARRAFDFVATTMGDAATGTPDRLRHAWRAGRPGPAGMLDDYVQMAGAALALFEATGETGYIDRARAWAESVERHFHDGVQGGYFQTADDAEALILRPKSAYDAALPSGNGSHLGVLARLFHLTGETVWRDRGDGLITAFGGEVSRNVFPLASLLNNVELLERLQQVVVVAPPGDPAGEALTRTVLDRSMPNRLLARVPPDASLPAGHPAAGKSLLDGRAAAYVCAGMTCQPPVSEPEALSDRLDAA